MPGCESSKTICENLRSAAGILANEAGAAPGITCAPDPHDIADPDLKQLYHYWLSLPAPDGGLPHQDHIDPFALRFILGHVNILEPLDAEGSDYRFRLGGTEVVNAYGFELTGKQVSKAFVPATAAFYLEAFRACHRGRAPLYIVETPHPSVPFWFWEHLLLPFADAAGTVSRLLCGMVAGPRRPKAFCSPPSPA